METMLNLQILKDLNNFDEDFSYLNKSLNLLKKKYGNKFVVIQNKKVRGSGVNIEEAVEKAKKNKVDVEKAVIEFIPKKEQEVLIL